VWIAVAGWLLAASAGGVAGILALALRRARRRHSAALGERGWLLERERETAARIAVDAERARIARDLHDIVSHNVSLMAAALSAIECAGRDTMTELRHLLGVLAPAQDGSDDDAVPAPQPSLSRLSPLVDRFAFAGLPVEMRISGEPVELPAGIDVTAHRIVQEALTNALRYGHGARAEVTIRYAEHALRVEVLNSGPSVLTADRPPPKPPEGTGAGRGLLGLRQRVAVYGGTLDARRRIGGGYRVRARIPLDRP
jgi:signal transduction histidine kinase